MTFLWKNFTISTSGIIATARAMGAMITYGSYLTKKENLESSAWIIVICDTVVALMAALAVFPAVFAFGMEPAGGPGLLFVTMQAVFDSMGAIGPVMQAGESMLIRLHSLQHSSQAAARRSSGQYCS